MSSSQAERGEPVAPQSPPHGSGKRVCLILLVLLLPPVFVRGLLLEVYAIQSDSMTPTFRAGDQLLVLKPTLDPRELQRWDAVILDRSVDVGVSEGVDAVIKRAVGLAGELVRISGGDVFAKPVEQPGELALVRKPDDVALGLLVPVHVGAGLEHPWVAVPESIRANLPGGTRLDGRAFAARAVYQAQVTDGQLDRNGEHAVGDTALEVLLGAVEVDSASCLPAVLTLTVREGADVFQARLPLHADGASAARSSTSSSAPAVASLHHRNAQPDQPVDTSTDVPGLRAGQRVLLWNVDNCVRVFVDGELILAHDYELNERRPSGSELHNDPRIEVRGAMIELAQVVVARDLHYTSQGDYGTDPGLGLSPCRVPSDGLFVLGDASTESRDSRYFGPVPLSQRRGRPLALLRPWARAGWLGPLGTTRGLSPGQRLEAAGLSGGRRDE